MNNITELHESITPQWLAGFFDGEGCVFIQKRKHHTDYSYDLRVQISQKDNIILAMILIKYPEASLYTQGKLVWQLHWRGESCRRFLNDIKNYCVVKRSQVLNALEYIETIPLSKSGRNGNSEEFNKKREELYIKIKEDKI